jgi:hypothetical protein
VISTGEHNGRVKGEEGSNGLRAAFNVSGVGEEGGIWNAQCSRDRFDLNKVLEREREREGKEESSKKFGMKSWINFKWTEGVKSE